MKIGDLKDQIEVRDLFKPILRPLSDLTKEIEVNGEKFVPIHRLFEIEYEGLESSESIRRPYTNNTRTFIESSHLGTARTTRVNILDLDKNNYWKINKLHEWHFDTKRLIEAGLAIDINTL